MSRRCPRVSVQVVALVAEFGRRGNARRAAAQLEEVRIGHRERQRPVVRLGVVRSEEHTSELQSLMRNSYAVFCLKNKINTPNSDTHYNTRQTRTQQIHRDGCTPLPTRQR